MRVLLVDDEQVALSRIQHVLIADGHEVFAFQSGQSAIDAFGDHIDLVLCDFYMPGVDGSTVFAHVRARRPETPFIYLTAIDEVEKTVELVRQGADDLIRKPVSPEALRLRIERVMIERERKLELEKILAEQELIRRENQRLATWRMLYAAKDTRRTQQLVENLSRNINSTGGFDWVDLLEEMKQQHDAEHYLIPQAVVDLAVSSARSHQSLIQRITDLGLIRTRELETEHVSLADLSARLQRTINERWAPMVNRRSRLLEVPARPGEPDQGGYSVDVDRNLLEAMVHELVCNAVKYSPDETPITVEWGPSSSGRSDAFGIRVSNVARHATATATEGESILGVPEAFQELVFEMFYTIESFPTTIEEEVWGDGTGLYIVRELAHKMGGWADITNGVTYSPAGPRPHVAAEIRLPRG
jgi:DNA-binding response OmpR family regulator